MEVPLPDPVTRDQSGIQRNFDYIRSRLFPLTRPFIGLKSIGAPQIDDDAVGPLQLANNSVASANIIDGTIDPADLSLATLALMAAVPSGSVLMTVSSTANTGFLLCDGGSYVRTTYPTLFFALGGTLSPFGLPDGTHFNVPDFRSRSPIGVGTGLGQNSSGTGAPSGSALTSRAMAGWTGDETHQLSTAEMPLHSHTQHAQTAYAAGPAVISGGANFGYTTAAGSQTGSNGSSNGHNNVPPVMAVNFQVKT